MTWASQGNTTWVWWIWPSSTFSNKIKAYRCFGFFCILPQCILVTWLNAKKCTTSLLVWKDLKGPHLLAFYKSPSCWPYSSPGLADTCIKTICNIGQPSSSKTYPTISHHICMHRVHTFIIEFNWHWSTTTSTNRKKEHKFYTLVKPRPRFPAIHHCFIMLIASIFHWHLLLIAELSMSCDLSKEHACGYTLLVGWSWIYFSEGRKC